MVERKEKKSSLKLFLLGVSLAVAVPIVAGLGVKAYEKYGDESKLRAKVNSYINDSPESVQRTRDKLRIDWGGDWKGDRRSFFERAEGFFEYISKYLKHL